LLDPQFGMLVVGSPIVLSLRALFVVAAVHCSIESVEQLACELVVLEFWPRHQFLSPTRIHPHRSLHYQFLLSFDCWMLSRTVALDRELNVVLAGLNEYPHFSVVRRLFHELLRFVLIHESH
jgi:hypothetical protein